MQAHAARGQSGPASSIAPGTFIARDSLDTRDEPATPSRVRSGLNGSATWTIELDSLDLKPKFTLRLEIPAPSPMTIVLRFADSLPPSPGTYKLMIPGIGSSHRSRNTMHGDVYAREGSRDRIYDAALRSNVSITSIATEGGQAVVAGRVQIVGNRYADGKPGQRVFDVVFLHIGGDFAARAASDPRPQVVITPAMQEAVLSRALYGFVITNSGASNGDGGVDSTRQSALARGFLESRWRDVAVIERVEVDGWKYEVRMRGRYTPVVCEIASAGRGYPECTRLPAPVSASGGQGAISGRVALRLAPYLPGSNAPIAAHLLPNPAPFKDAYRTWCDRMEKVSTVADVAFEAKLKSTSDDGAREALERDYISTLEKQILRDRKEYRKLFASFAILHATTGPDGQFAFTSVPPGNYLLFSALPTEDRIEWYLPIVVQGGEQLSRDLDGSNVNRQEWSCGTPLPFPAVHEQKE